MRVCSNCNLNKTYIDPRGDARWYAHKNGWYCQKCYDKLIHHPKSNPIDNPKRLGWTPKRKSIFLKENPRKGVCQNCGKQGGKTDMHHIQYHEDDPLKDTIELCASCHGKITFSEHGNQWTFK